MQSPPRTTFRTANPGVPPRREKQYSRQWRLQLARGALRERLMLFIVSEAVLDVADNPDMHEIALEIRARLGPAG